LKEAAAVEVGSLLGALPSEALRYVGSLFVQTSGVLPDLPSQKLRERTIRRDGTINIQKLSVAEKIVGDGRGILHPNLLRFDNPAYCGALAQS
jgi:hypothetical protein